MPLFDAPLIETEAGVARYAAVSRWMYWSAGILMIVVGWMLAYFSDRTWLNGRALYVYALGVFLGGMTGSSATQLKMVQLYHRLMAKSRG